MLELKASIQPLGSAPPDAPPLPPAAAVDDGPSGRVHDVEPFECRQYGLFLLLLNASDQPSGSGPAPAPAADAAAGGGAAAAPLKDGGRSHVVSPVATLRQYGIFFELLNFSSHSEAAADVEVAAAAALTPEGSVQLVEPSTCR